jgi:tetratricopeptide (TPR) repeat protein
MIDTPVTGIPTALTDGEIAVVNLNSAGARSWNLFWRDPLRAGIAENLVEQEHLTAQFVGDLTALDRLGTLVQHLDRIDERSPRFALIRAQVASMGHRFADAKMFLEEVDDWGDLSENAKRLSLSIDQATGTKLDALLETRTEMAAKSGRLEDFVPLAALHADLRDFDEAARIYQKALREYSETSPFAVALVCFQLGAVWGELVPKPEPARAARWYQRAIEYLPCYVKARVHLSEILLAQELEQQAEALLIPAISSGDPEVRWRLANVMTQMGRLADAETHHGAAQYGFDSLLEAHLLAFADHGAEFYSGSGNDPVRAFELANINVMNRPTLRAFEQAYETAVGAGEFEEAENIAAAAGIRWGATKAFGLSRFAEIQE